MKANETDMRVMLAAGLLGLAWYLYTRSRGLSLTGQYQNPMLLPPAQIGNAMSPVAPNNSVGLAATNVFSAISKAIATVASSFKSARGGNAPASSSDTAAGVNARTIGSATSSQGPDLGEIQVPFWSWGFDPVAPDPFGVPSLAYWPKPVAPSQDFSNLPEYTGPITFG